MLSVYSLYNVSNKGFSVSTELAIFNTEDRRQGVKCLLTGPSEDFLDFLRFSSSKKETQTSTAAMFSIRVCSSAIAPFLVEFDDDVIRVLRVIEQQLRHHRHVHCLDDGNHILL